jgi:hypothetical protein
MVYTTTSIPFTLILCFAFHITFCQSNLEIKFNEKSETVTVAGLTLDSNVTNDQVIEAMGKPSKQVDYPSGEVSLFYEEKGVVFFTMKNTVAGLGINFNSDGDKKFPATSFNGQLKIGSSEITKESKQNDVLGIKEVAFVCPYALMCACSKRDSKTIATIAFKNGALTQVSFLLNTSSD